MRLQCGLLLAVLVLINQTNGNIPIKNKGAGEAKGGWSEGAASAPEAKTRLPNLERASGTPIKKKK